MASVDVFIPCYKYAHYLRGCVESVLKQEGVDVRVLILDDCSPDNTPEVARQLMADDSRVEYHRNATNRGHIETYNIGIEWCAGDYCLLLSADDMLVPGALARAARVMNEHPDVALTYGGEIRAADPRFDQLPNAATFGWRVITGGEFWAMSCEQAKNLVPTPSAVARTAIHKQVGGYRKDLPHSGDLEMWLRLAAYGSVGIIDAPQGVYRVHGNNMSKGYAGLGDLRQKKAAFDIAAEAYGGRVAADLPRLLEHVNRLVAQDAFWSAHQSFDSGDMRACRECLEYASGVWPGISTWSPWRRLQFKQLFGFGVWSTVRPVLAWARRLRQACAM
ncbi:MAG TPA: glycosyltransferase [Tepidisphaeraceae bacterium]|jgi:glycosyltransferase involved in cell wall biosynthesis